MAITEVRQERGREAQPEEYSGAGLTLGAAFRIFAGTFNARLLAFAFVAAVATRVALGGWRWWDLGVVVIVLGMQPFTEWLIHVFVLHAKPKQVGSIKIDGLLARKHRQHHAKPKVIGLVLVPRRALITSVLTAVPLYWLVTGIELAAGCYLARRRLRRCSSPTSGCTSSSTPATSRSVVLPLHLQGPPPAPLPQRELLVRRDHSLGRPRVCEPSRRRRTCRCHPPHSPLVSTTLRSQQLEY